MTILEDWVYWTDPKGYLKCRLATLEDYATRRNTP